MHCIHMVYLVYTKEEDFILNSLNMIGRIAQDIELKVVGEKGTQIINNALAVTDKKDRNKSNFISFTLIGKSAENFSKIVKKGDLISIENAELKVDNYTNKDGEKRSRTYALAFNFQLLKSAGQKNNDKQTDKDSVEPNPFENSNIPQDDDLPF